MYRCDTELTEFRDLRIDVFLVAGEYEQLRDVASGGATFVAARTQAPQCGGQFLQLSQTV